MDLIINCVIGNCSGNEYAQPQDLSDAIEYPSAPPGSKGTYQSPYGFPTDPTKAPAEGFKWEGRGGPETGKGNWINEETGEKFYWDPKRHKINHYDYTAPDGIEWRIWPDGSMSPKY